VRKSSRLESSQPRSERKVLPSRLRGATGLTPKDQTPSYEVRCGLASGDAVTEAIYEAGFNTSTRFCEESTDMLGMSTGWLRNEEINLLSAERSSAPCRLPRPRSVAPTRRAAPR
jgi:methylphosphotriester-DNA--protein-cysteine methyltransferase